MLNKKALEAAKRAVAEVDHRPVDDVPMKDLKAHVNALKAVTAIEAYLAALPDEDGLIEETRIEAGVWEGTFGSPQPTEANPEVLAKLLNRLADALEAARAKTPEGWRLVPEELTDDMTGLAIAACGNEVSPEEIATIWDNLLAAVPEVSNDR